ncbi:tetratricopeptide repeat protein [Methyloprofundus sp.]|uniref:tetratricopeptide repeat protein n=1 Tax=Methyloprofundus sp. TaxID=2020875 RepID=UPI003D11A951
MNNLIRNSLTIALLSLSLLNTAPTICAEQKKSTTVSPWAYKQLNKAEKLIAKQEYAKARQKLQKILAEADKNSYEQAITLRSLASVYALENKYKPAASYLEQALASNALTEEQQQETLFNLGQLYMATEQYQKAVDTLAPWLKKHPQTTDTQVRILLANAYAQLQQYRKALPYIEHVIKHSKKPKASWLQLNLALYYELEDYPKAASILRRLIALFPDKKEYWQQLAAIFQQLKQFDNALAIKNLAYKKGFLDSEGEIKQLFNLFLYNNQPYQAAALLARELDAKSVNANSANWELLANAWTSAREYNQAVKALEKASALHAKGELYLQLGRIHIEQELWQEAINALKKALKKGGLKRAGEAYILLGISYYETEQITPANKAFTHALNYSKTRKSAQQWLKYITPEASS